MNGAGHRVAQIGWLRHHVLEADRLLEPLTGSPVVDRLIPVNETLFTSFNLVYLTVISLIGNDIIAMIDARR